MSRIRPVGWAVGVMVWAVFRLTASVAPWGPGAVDVAGAATGPTASASTQIASAGELVTLTGAGWTPVGDTVLVQICGQDAVDLSSDCDQSNAVSAAIRSGGVFYAGLYVKVPPVPCPCVIVVSDPGGQSRNLPLQIAGAPVAAVPPTPRSSAPATLTASLTTPISVSSWFGGPRRATLVVRVTNVSAASFPDPVAAVTVGRGADPTEFAAGGSLAPVPAGATRTERFPVTIPAPTFGHYTVRVQLGTGLGTVATSVPTSSWPWGWLVVLGVVVLMMVLRSIRRRRRRERQRTPADPDPTDPPPVDPPNGSDLAGRSATADHGSETVTVTVGDG